MFPSGRASNTNKRQQIVTEDEYIADVFGSTGFATTPYSLNPGQLATFPWAYKIASLYEKWKTLHVEFYYKPQVSAYATNGQSGKVMLSFDYDSSDAAPTTKQQVEDTVPHQDAMPYESVRLRLDAKQLNGQDSKYIRPGTQPANTDIKTYDGGILYVSTDGNTNTNVIGELRVRYSFMLMCPVLENSSVYTSSFAHVQESLSETAVAAHPFGQAGPVLTSDSNLPSGTIQLVSTTTIGITVPGTYFCSFSWLGANIAGEATVTPGANITAAAVFSRGTASNAYAYISANALYDVIFVVSTAGINAANQIVVTGLTSMTGAYCDVWIMALPTAINAMRPVDDRLERLEQLERRLKFLMPDAFPQISNDKLNHLGDDVDEDTVSIASSCPALTNNNGNSQSASCASAIMRRALSRKA
jgi:hypothetical protein